MFSDREPASLRRPISRRAGVSGSGRSSRAAALFDFIDGGAEIFIEFGFERVLVQRYAKGEAELTLEAYEMTDADAALGIYLMKCGVETPVAGLPARHTGDPAQLTILKGRYFLHVNSFGAGPDLTPEMIALARRALDAVPDERAGRHLDRLPAEGLVAGSARLLRGPYGLQSIVTLGEDDILSWGGKVIAVTGDYRAANETWTLIVSPYPDEAAASAALAYLRAHLDSYLEVTEERPDGFVFKDFKKQVRDRARGRARSWSSDSACRGRRIEKPGLRAKARGRSGSPERNSLCYHRSLFDPGANAWLGS